MCHSEYGLLLLLLLLCVVRNFEIVETSEKMTWVWFSELKDGSSHLLVSFGDFPCLVFPFGARAKRIVVWQRRTNDDYIVRIKVYNFMYIYIYFQQ